MFKRISWYLLLTSLDFSSGQWPPFSLSSVANQRVVGGIVVDIQANPFVVVLLRHGLEICGGALIAQSIVLTAAHCVNSAVIRDTDELRIRVGSSNEYSGGLLLSVRRIFVHPMFNSELMTCDIAVVELHKAEQARTFGAIPIAMWEEEVQFRPGTVAEVYGWGAVKEGGKIMSILRKAAVPIVDTAKCAAVFQKPITPRHICAGYDRGGSDACQGDSGGPLVVSGKLAGIVSFGRGCARAGFPGVYTSVMAYRQWIRQTAFV